MRPAEASPDCARNARWRAGAGAQRDLRRAGIGGLRQDIARGQRGGHMLGFMDGVAADLEALADRKHFVEAGGVVLHRQRESEYLEHRAEFVNVLRHAVAARIAVAELRAWDRIGQRRHREDFAGVDVHHDAAGRPGAEFSRAASISCESVYWTRMSIEVATARAIYLAAETDAARTTVGARAAGSHRDR